MIDVGDCTRIYKGHHHSVSCIQVENGLGRIGRSGWIRELLSSLVYTGCGDAIVRCFDARSGVLRRAFKSHALAINCIQVNIDSLLIKTFSLALRSLTIGYSVVQWMVR